MEPTTLTLSSSASESSADEADESALSMTDAMEDAEDAAESSGSRSGDGQARIAAAAARWLYVDNEGLVGVGGGDSRGGGAAGGKDVKGRTE